MVGIHIFHVGHLSSGTAQNCSGELHMSFGHGSKTVMLCGTVRELQRRHGLVTKDSFENPDSVRSLL